MVTTPKHTQYFEPSFLERISRPETMVWNNIKNQGADWGVWNGKFICGGKLGVWMTCQNGVCTHSSKTACLPMCLGSSFSMPCFPPLFVPLTNTHNLTVFASKTPICSENPNFWTFFTVFTVFFLFYITNFFAVFSQFRLARKPHVRPPAQNPFPN